MSSRPPKSTLFEGPCTTCAEKAVCIPYAELHEHLFSHAKFQREPERSPFDSILDEVVQNYIVSLRKLISLGAIPTTAIGNALSALVDLCITGIYTNGLISDQVEFSQKALLCSGTRVFFPYTWMCPLCVSQLKPREECYLPLSRREVKKGSVRDYPQVDWLAKPGGRAIGDQGILAVKALLRATLKASGTNARLRDGGGARGEFDLTIATDSILSFIEVKAKPLISYPLVGRLLAPRVLGGANHEWLSVSINDVSDLSLFLAGVNTSIPLSIPTPDSVSSWPLGDIAANVRDVDSVANIVLNWTKHAEAYTQWVDEPDHLRWHRFGCGNFHVTEEGRRVEKRVANTKELPGLDRTDDIKKGAAQVLKYSRLKFQCSQHALRAVLLGNTHALTHYDDYVSPLLHLKVIDGSSDSNHAEWIFDAMIGLTKNHFNAKDLIDIFAFERLIENLLSDDEVLKLQV